MRYALLKCDWGGNTALAECEADTQKEATEKLKDYAPVPLDFSGYARQGKFSFVVGEIFGS